METKTLINGIAMVLPRAGSVQETAYSVQGEAHVIATELKPVILSTSEESNTHDSELMIHDSENNVLADKVLQSAKEDGFEEALTHLADGDFKKFEEISDFETLDTGLEIPESEFIDEPVITLEMQFYVEKVQILEEKVKVLTEQNQELAYRIKNLETQKAQELFTLAELIRIYEEMIADEPKVEEKAGLLEILVYILKEFVNGLTEPEKEGAEKSQPAEEVEKPTFMQFLKAFQASRQN